MKKIYLITLCAAYQLLQAQAPSLQWVKAFQGTERNGASAIKTNSLSEVFTAGTFSGTVDFDPGPGVYTVTAVTAVDAYVVKTDASGGFIWAKTFGADRVEGLALDPTGNIFVGGLFWNTVDFDPGPAQVTLSTTSIVQQDQFILKLDASGNFLWVRQFEGQSSFSNIYGMTSDPAGNIIATGWFRGGIDFDPTPGPTTPPLVSSGNLNGDAFTVKLTGAGNYAWAIRTGTTAIDDYGYSIVSDAAGNLFTTGIFGGTVDFDPGPAVVNYTAAPDGGYVTKLTPGGNLVWARSLNGSLAMKTSGIALDAAANVYYCGSLAGTADFDLGAGTFTLTSAGNRDLFVSKLDSAGNFGWAKRMGTTALDEATDIAVDGVGNAWISGPYKAVFDMDPGASTYTVPLTGGTDDIYISKFDAAGSFIWGGVVGGTAYNNNNFDGTTVDGAGNFYACGSFSNTCDFDPGAATSTLSSAGNLDGFIMKLNGGGTTPSALETVAAQLHLLVYPNPVTNVMTFKMQGLSGASVIEVYNVLGVLVQSQAITASEATMDLSAHDKGLLFVRVLNNGAVVAVRSIVKE